MSHGEGAGVNLRSAQRNWAAHGLTPYLLGPLKLSNDPKFIAKVHDIIDLYVIRPSKAISSIVEFANYLARRTYDQARTGVLATEQKGVGSNNA
jgi:hypothetical protein